ncbi:MAG: hypothetical protein EB023_10560, partial [Flavobacteriia bacterium]|nr:hypothetical protein [Flavobacteriia bacterium]
MRISLPSTFGPGVLLPCSLFAFICGYFLPVEGGFTMELSMAIVLLVSLFLVQNRWIYILLLLLTCMTLGIFASRPVSRMSQCKQAVYLRWTKVQKRGKVYKSVGQLYARKGLDLIPTGREIYCTILPNNTIPREGTIALVPVQITRIMNDEHPGAFEIN